MRRRGWEVIVLVRKPESTQAQSLARMGAHLVAGDVTDRESMRAAMQGADLVVHNAGHYEYGLTRQGVQRMQSVNVTGTENVLSLAHELHIPRTSHVSSVQAFGDSGAAERDETFVRQAPCRTVYEQTKTEAHEIALQYLRRGLSLIIVCPHGVVGANDHSQWGYFLRLYLNRILPPVAWAPDANHGSVYVHDLAEGIALAAEKGRTGETYLFCGENLPIRKHLDHWFRVPGSFRPLIWLPAPAAAILFAPLSPMLRALGLPAFISREAAYGAGTNWHYSSAKARSELGWTHLSAEAMWQATIAEERSLLDRRKGQSLIQRLQPLESAD
jgi:dihydroflavonol-4-reductase